MPTLIQSEAQARQEMAELAERVRARCRAEHAQRAAAPLRPRVQQDGHADLPLFQTDPEQAIAAATHKES